ncbi:sulfatase-like hydrolase/transferase [Sphingorhabdus sp. Alg231-15]|uniref:sulfatase-like hydrolase/transferase n=1 Tax=Sphingorhabdus sp. Alg231-15 TaxID=1922222 RepID=UPI00307B6905
MINSTDSKWLVSRLIAGFLLFSATYALINQLPLTQTILYRAAAHDYASAIWAALSFALQAIILLIATIVLPRRWFTVLVIAMAISAGVNMVYGQIVGNMLDMQKTGWLMAEARQAGDAAGEFLMPLGIALGKLILAMLLLIGARRIMRPSVPKLVRALSSGKGSRVAILILLAVPSLLWPSLNLYPLAAERNLYNFAATIWTADPPPPRAQVSPVPDKNGGIRKIIWLIDESISYPAFQQIIRPDLATTALIDFGEAASMGHCSTPSNVAMRSGVNVRTVDNRTDLRRTPSIWAYATKAGFATSMIDGQVTGPPQNLLQSPERALIDSYQNAASGLKTDLTIARSINASLKSDGKQFTYAILRGVHFQYQDHYPKGALPQGSSTQAQYEKAIAYSKKDFFATLLDGVDRSEVAIFYTSDHGQNIADGVTPHCSGSPVKAEFSVPLVAFLPSEIAESYKTEEGGRSLSQLFPTTLALMGYDTDYATENYDNILSTPTVRYVWFGRGVVPVKNGGAIDVQTGQDFPGR